MAEPARMPKRLLSARDVQQLTGLSRSSAYELMHALGCFRVLGRCTRLPKARLDAYMRQLKAPLVALSHAPIMMEALCSLPGLDMPPTAGVYVIQGAGGYVKIGKARDIAARIAHLQVAHPVRLRLLAVLSGEPADEAERHRRWAHLRREGEWFEPDHELLDHLSQADIS